MIACMHVCVRACVYGALLFFSRRCFHGLCDNLVVFALLARGRPAPKTREMHSNRKEHCSDDMLPRAGPPWATWSSLALGV